MRPTHGVSIGMTISMRAALIALWLGVFGISATFDAAPASASCLPGILQQRLSQIRSQFGSVTIISTHRPGARVAGSGRRSLHASCRAVHFKVCGNKGAAIAWLEANHALHFALQAIANREERAQIGRRLLALQHQLVVALGAAGLRHALQGGSPDSS